MVETLLVGGRGILIPLSEVILSCFTKLQKFYIHNKASAYIMTINMINGQRRELFATWLDMPASHQMLH